MALHRIPSQWVQAVPDRVRLLVPKAGLCPSLSRPTVDRDAHYHWLTNTQRFRARSYLADGAVQASDVVLGRWICPEDGTALQLVLCDRFGLMVGALWIELHPSPILEELHCYHPTTRDALARERRRARTEGVGFIEMGGWVATSSRANLLLLLLTGALHQALPPSLASVVITTRRRAHEMIRAMGGTSPHGQPYMDDRFGCAMELLTLDSRHRDTPYQADCDALMPMVPQIPVLAALP